MYPLRISRFSFFVFSAFLLAASNNKPRIFGGVYSDMIYTTNDGCHNRGLEI